MPSCYLDFLELLCTTFAAGLLVGMTLKCSQTVFSIDLIYLFSKLDYYIWLLVPFC